MEPTEFKPTINATIVYLVNPVDGTVIMVKKTREPGIGYWFGYGGKIEEGETPEMCTCRETADESGKKMGDVYITILPENLERVALIDFYKGSERPLGNPTFRVLCYRATRWTGETIGTDEMSNLQPFSIHDLPFHEMKPGDELFVPQIIAGTSVKGWIRSRDDEKEFFDSDVNPCRIEDLVI